MENLLLVSCSTKAFDTFDRDILPAKLSTYGIMMLSELSIK